MPFIYGTIVSSLLALLISVPLSLGVAVFLVEQAPRRLSRPITFLVELLAAIPSVVYGLWGIFVLAPLLRQYVEPPLQSGSVDALFPGPITGIGFSPRDHSRIMSRDHLAVVRTWPRPVTQREAALALGATNW